MHINQIGALLLEELAQLLKDLQRRARTARSDGAREIQAMDRRPLDEIPPGQLSHIVGDNGDRHTAFAQRRCQRIDQDLDAPQQRQIPGRDREYFHWR